MRCDWSLRSAYIFHCFCVSQFEWQLKDYARTCHLVFSGKVENVDTNSANCTIKSIIKGAWSESYITLLAEHVALSLDTDPTPASFRLGDACFGRDLADLKERDSRVFFTRASPRSSVHVVVAHVHVSKIALTTLRSWPPLLGECCPLSSLSPLAERFVLGIRD